MRILVMAGSIRTGSHSAKLAHFAHRRLAAMGVSPTLLSLRDYEMPLYDGDIEAASGLPEAALRLRQVLAEHEALCIVTPEYNNSLPSLLKNSLDWVSRTADGVSGGVFFRGKPTAIMSASPGYYGGIRALAHLRQVMNALGALVLAEQYALPQADKAFDGEQSLVEPRAADSMQKVLQALVDVSAKLNA